MTGNALALALVAAISLNCAPPRAESAVRSELAADEAAALRPPGSDELAHVGAERRMTVDGPGNAFDGRIFGTQVPQADVFLYYSRELERLGWKRDSYQVFASTGELDAWGWCKPRMRFRLAIKKPNNFEPSFYQGKVFTTVFDARLIGRDPDVPCPIRP